MFVAVGKASMHVNSSS